MASSTPALLFSDKRLSKIIPQKPASTSIRNNKSRLKLSNFDAHQTGGSDIWGLSKVVAV